MLAILYALGKLAVDLLKSRGRLEAENLLLRHQLNVVFRIAAIPILAGLHHANTLEYNFRKEQQLPAVASRTM
jgi:hypothetical protein